VSFSWQKKIDPKADCKMLVKWKVKNGFIIPPSSISI